MNMNRRRAAGILLWILLAATLTFIFTRSMKSAEDSSAESLRVLALVRPILQPLFGDVTEHIVRKLAHFTEYCALGMELSGLLICFRRLNPHMFLHCLSFAFFTAAIDETIQIFSQRGSQLQDVWLDFAGAVVGIAVVCAIGWLFRRRTV